jgi:hypothetical protein
VFYFDERLLRISNLSLSLSRLFCLSSWKMLILHSCNRQKRPSDIKSENNWTKAKKISAPKCKIAKILSRWKQKQKQNYKTRDVCCFSIKTNRQSDEKVIIQMIVLYFVLSFVSRNQFWFTKLSHVALWLTRPTTKTQMIFSFASSTTTNDSIFFPTLTKTPFHFFTNLFFCAHTSCGSYYLVECIVSLSAFNWTSSLFTYLSIISFIHKNCLQIMTDCCWLLVCNFAEWQFQSLSFKISFNLGSSYFEPFPDRIFC